VIRRASTERFPGRRLGRVTLAGAADGQRLFDIEVELAPAWFGW
jgi:hypothetical protein